MKFLLDQSADFRLMPHLRARGHDVTALSRNYPPGLPDEDVLTIAREEARVLIVADRDFGELIFQQELAHAGVIAAPGKFETKCSAYAPQIRATD